MNLKQLITDEDAVSPVIGVILMVAITVILAAVIGTFVLGIGQDQSTTPNATFEFDYNGSGNAVEITHSGGDTFTSENTGELRVLVNGAADGNSPWTLPVSSGTPFTTGTSSWSSGDQIRVVWEAPGGGKTQTVGDFTVP